MSRDGPELFDQATRDRVRRDAAPAAMAAFAFIALLVAGLFAGVHHEWPIFSRMAGTCAPGQYAYECRHAGFDVLAGTLGGVAFGALSMVALRFRRIPPTVRCHSCDRVGWVMDLEAREGRCPRCGGSRFAYTIVVVGPPGGVLLRRHFEADVDGVTLVDRFRATRRSTMTRYY